MNKQELIREFEDKVGRYFRGLRFIDKSHEYFVDDRKIPKSVTGLIKSFVKPVDFKAIAKYTDKRDGLEPGTTWAAWELKKNTACIAGKETHNFAEHREEKQLIAGTEKEEAVVNFWSELFEKNPGRYWIIKRELPMYHRRYFFSGTCDFILYDTYTGKFIIGDYKTNEDLFKNYKDKYLCEPFDFLLDCPYNHYQLQLSFYEILFKQLGYEILERWVIWLKPDKEYKVYKTYDYSNYLEEWMIKEKNRSLLIQL